MYVAWISSEKAPPITTKSISFLPISPLSLQLTHLCENSFRFIYSRQSCVCVVVEILHWQRVTVAMETDVRCHTDEYIRRYILHRGKMFSVVNHIFMRPGSSGAYPWHQSNFPWRAMSGKGASPPPHLLEKSSSTYENAKPTEYSNGIADA